MRSTFERREKLTTHLLGQISEHVDDVLLEVGTEISEDARKEIETALLAHARTVLDALPFTELENEGAVEAFAISIRREARSMVNQEIFQESRKKSR